MDESIRKLKELLDGSDNIVFFGGAGVSTESGIPDFRSVDGLYHQKFRYPPETMLSHTFFEKHTEEFFDFYRAKMLALDAQPNAAHRKLAQWEQEGRLKAVITQNIDGLHQKAGSREVLELHGSVLRNHCTRCGKFYGVERIVNSTGVPRCDCGGVIKPDVVLYEEALDEDVPGEEAACDSKNNTKCNQTHQQERCQAFADVDSQIFFADSKQGSYSARRERCGKRRKQCLVPHFTRSEHLYRKDHSCNRRSEHARKAGGHTGYQKDTGRVFKR